MHTSQPGDPGSSDALDDAEPNTTISEATKQDPANEDRATEQSDTSCTHVPDDERPRDKTFDATEGAGLSSSHKNPADADENVRQSQNGVSNSSEGSAEINEELRKELEKYKEQVQNSKNLTKALVTELNKVKAQGQSHMSHHVTDSDLVAKVKVLRYNIKNITVQCFEIDLIPFKRFGRTSKLKNNDPVPSLGMKWGQFSTLMQSDSSHRILLVQALIWATLCDTLFGKFMWASEKAATAMRNMKDDLLPKHNDTSKEDRPQAMRRWHMWRATTSIVLLERPPAAVKDGQSRQNGFCSRTIDSLSEILKPFAGSELDNFATGLREIVDEAMDLDKVMNKQVPALKWIYKLDKLPDEYSPDQMEFDAEDQTEMPQKDNRLIVNPGLKKRGKSTGQDFDQMVVLSTVKLADTSSWVATGSKKK